MPDVLLARPADSPGYVRLTLADPLGTSQAGEVVQAGEHTLVIHGQREFDIPADAVEVRWPDGSVYRPSSNGSGDIV